jgi:hypothetical protein
MSACLSYRLVIVTLRACSSFELRPRAEVCIVIVSKTSFRIHLFREFLLPVDGIVTQIQEIRLVVTATLVSLEVT